MIHSKGGSERGQLIIIDIDVDNGCCKIPSIYEQGIHIVNLMCEHLSSCGHELLFDLDFHTRTA